MDLVGWVLFYRIITAGTVLREELAFRNSCWNLTPGHAQTGRHIFYSPLPATFNTTSGPGRGSYPSDTTKVALLAFADPPRLHISGILSDFWSCM